MYYGKSQCEQGNTFKRVLYVSTKLTDKMRFDGSLCERVREYEKITKNCRFCHKRSRDVEIVTNAQILFVLLATKNLASLFHEKSDTKRFLLRQ